MYELLIQNGDRVFQPPVLEQVSFSTERNSTPGSLEFSFIDTGISISEGNPVRFKEDEQEIFYGFIFKISRDRSKLVKITAYDQLRYLKNKDSLSYENKTAGELAAMIAANYGMNPGVIADTIWKIPFRSEDNQTLLDMISNALDLTLQNTGDLYILYDKFGKLNLTFLGDMFVPIVIDEETGQNYGYESSIDSDTYNKIKLTYENEETGVREIYITQDSGRINDWGLLQYYESIQKGENGQAKADALLKLYNKPVKTLSIQGACGDSRVRGGSLVPVLLDLGDVKLQNLMLVEKCTHRYGESMHTMDLTLSGGDFSA